MFKEILEFNQEFVKNREYIEFATDKFPSKNMAILTCMDTRLTKLLPAALNIQNGDVKIIKNAGALVTKPYGSVMRSLVIAIHELGVNEIIVIGHYSCGMHNLKYDKLKQKIIESGIDETTLNEVNAEIDVEKWLEGFTDEHEQIRDTIKQIKSHKLIPESITVHGCLIDPTTGELTVVE